ncbi:MAG TPA: hypothetical protein VE175_09635, partial [Woeseiaceae bacterium]|nr:hypothetical protein [Woeseiaceae bacterium]
MGGALVSGVAKRCDELTVLEEGVQTFLARQTLHVPQQDLLRLFGDLRFHGPIVQQSLRYFGFMRLVDQLLRLSATDLANHLSCAHLSQLSRAVAEGRAEKPQRHDPIAEILRERGWAHEKAYLEHLQAEGVEVVVIPEEGGEAESVERTRAAMREGAELIYQAPLGNARWYGRADFLQRVDS